jgi:uncharacterized protein YbjT (DUF2867 family)
MAERKILIAGATGCLGQYLVQESKKQGYWTRALTRDAQRLAHLRDYIDDVYVGQVTDQDSISTICQDIDFVISAVGITRQKDHLTYMDVDYQGNRNLLDCALSIDVSKFVYVSVFNAQLMHDLRIIQAKERFVSDLKQSPLDYTIIRATGFFLDMLEFLNMARKDKVNLFGSGEYRVNPIHGQDLAKVCVDALLSLEKEIEVGGPETFTHRQIAELAFDLLNKDAKTSCMPLWLKNVVL